MPSPPLQLKPHNGIHRLELKTYVFFTFPVLCFSIEKFWNVSFLTEKRFIQRLTWKVFFFPTQQTKWCGLPCVWGDHWPSWESLLYSLKTSGLSSCTACYCCGRELYVCVERFFFTLKHFNNIRRFPQKNLVSCCCLSVLSDKTYLKSDCELPVHISSVGVGKVGLCFCSGALCDFYSLPEALVSGKY